MCIITGFITVILLGASLLTFSFIAYDRWKAICRPFEKPKWILTIYPHVAMYIISAVGMVTFVVGGGSRMSLQPSGLYCNVDSFTVASVIGVCFFVGISMGLSGIFYFLIARTIRKMFGSKESKEEKAQRKSVADKEHHEKKKANKELKLVFNFLLLMTWYVVLWVPALIMTIAQGSRLASTENPWFDIVAALGATINSGKCNCDHLVAAATTHAVALFTLCYPLHF